MCAESYFYFDGPARFSSVGLQASDSAVRGLSVRLFYGFVSEASDDQDRLARLEGVSSCVIVVCGSIEQHIHLLRANFDQHRVSCNVKQEVIS